MTAAPLAARDTSLATEAAGAAAAVLPSVHPLTVSAAQPGSPSVTSPYRAAIVSRVTGSATAMVGILVGDELVDVLESSPTPGLMLAATVQPAIDAAARILGTTAEAAVQLDPAELLATLDTPFTVVPLVGPGFAAAFLLTDDALAPAMTAAGDDSPTFAVMPLVPPELVTHAPTAVQDPVGAPAPQAAPTVVARRGIEMLHGVDMELTVELGRTRMAVRDLLALAPGDVLELDRAAGSPADLLVNGRLIARGEVVVVDEDFGLRITQIIEANVS